MKHPISYPKSFSATIYVVFCVGFLFLCAPAFSQNTKGDSPSGNRENRFKIGSKKNKKARNNSKRIRSKNRSIANSGRENVQRRRPTGDQKLGRPIKPVYNVKPPRNDQKAWKGDITGRRIKPKKSSASRYIHPQGGRYVRKSVPEREGVRNVSKNRSQIRSRTGQTVNVFPQKSARHFSNRSPKHGDRRAVSNRAQVSQLKGPRTSEHGIYGNKKYKVVPKSKSKPYIARKSINVYANFKRPKRKSERATTRDLAGKKIRGRNYETPRPGLIDAMPLPSQYRKRVGDRPYSGSARSGYKTATKPSRAWTGDVANRKIRHRNRTSKPSIEGIPIPFGGYLSRSPRKKPYPARGYRTATRPGETRPGKAPLPPRPGLRYQGEGFTGMLKTRRPEKGGGSVSGRLWNNRGTPIEGRQPRQGLDAGRFQGNLKTRRPEKGGGSVSGKLWNNRETPIDGRLPKQGLEAGRFQGNIKANRPEKGGGSVSGKLWNNRETPIEGRQPKQGLEAGRFQGNLKTKRPEKGGGSVSGKLWNNRETPVEVRQPKLGLEAGRFQGNLKTKRPEKGGGSVSGKLWNNDETPILVRTPSANATKAGKYTGNLKYKYIQNKNAAEESLKKKQPDKTVSETEGLQVRVQRRAYVRNKNISADALLKLKPTQATNDASGLQVKVKQYKYKRNPSSAADALKVREPGKAFARITDYQGNIKMKKFNLFEKNELHPDSRFIKINKNNVAAERDVYTNFRLWWARLFKKQETQPDHLKEKGKKPRYDNGEQGMWYD